MTVTARLFATFRDGRGKELVMDLAEGSTASDVLKLLRIKPQDVAMLLCNGRDGGLQNALKEGDRISLFPPVGGG